MTDTEPVPEIDGFTFIKLLGRGGMASVWEARQHDPDRVVAIKLLDEDIAQSPEDVERFYAEARNAAQLDHANIVTVFEVGCQKGRYYYVMELAAGYDTGKWMKRKGHLKPTDTLTIAESVALALDYAERSIGIIHCDIKPANIMVDGDGTVRLTDLGIARFVRNQNANDDDSIFGTPAYMAPEVVRGVPDLDARSDMYSLGATLYHLLTGHPLFEGFSENDIMLKQCNEQVPDVRDINPEVSAPYAALLSLLLAKDRDARPRTWSLAIRDIQRVASNRMPLDPIPPREASTMLLREDPSAFASSAPAFTPVRESLGDRLAGSTGKSRRHAALFLAALLAVGALVFTLAYVVTSALVRT